MERRADHEHEAQYEHHQIKDSLVAGLEHNKEKQSADDARLNDTEVSQPALFSLEYALARLERCPFGGEKPKCSACPVHCYKPAQREQARLIMRYAGPRMLLRHPLLAIAHQLDGLRKARHPGEMTREQRLSARKKEQR